MISNWIKVLCHDRVDRVFFDKIALTMVFVIALFARITFLIVGKTYILPEKRQHSFVFIHLRSGMQPDASGIPHFFP